jgi:hypothetical protein
MNPSDIIGLIGVLELPFTILGSYLLFKKITKSRELQEWIGLVRESKETLKKILEEYNKRNGNVE